jgi:hypothetical protein
MNRLLMLFAAMLAFAAVPVLAQSERAYTEGSVIDVTSVRVKDGQWDAYISYLNASYKPVLEEQKKAGIILDYSIYATTARRPDEPNLYLTVVYPNMASFDGLEDKVEPLARKVTGQDRAQSDKAYADRSTMREILGSELIRELKLK